MSILFQDLSGRGVVPLSSDGSLPPVSAKTRHRFMLWISALGGMRRAVSADAGQAQWQASQLRYDQGKSPVDLAPCAYGECLAYALPVPLRPVGNRPITVGKASFCTIQTPEGASLAKAAAVSANSGCE